MDSILIVCRANYCRSPVAEQLIKKQVECEDRKIIIDSAGTSNFFRSSMDPRSERYLIESGVSPSIHIPKKITNKLVKQFSLILAMDVALLIDLSRQFQRSKNKLKLFSSISNNLPIEDPYTLNDEKYYEIMDTIKDVCSLWAAEIKN